MAKTRKGPSGKFVAKPGDTSFKIVRDAKTGQFITVLGAGSLKGRGPRIKKGISLTKPIARQALSKRAVKRKAG